MSPSGDMARSYQYQCASAQQHIAARLYHLGMKTLISLAICALGISGLAQAAQFELTNVAQLSAGATHACVVAGGSAKCWGSNSHGQLGGGAVGSSRGVASDVLGLTSGVVAVA